MKTLLIKKKPMQSIINPSKRTYLFLNNNFSCQICNEIPNNPIILKCEHILCDNCLLKNQKIKSNCVICPFCNSFSEINNSDNLKLKLLMDNIKEMDDIEFNFKFGNFIFDNENYNKIQLFSYLINIREKESKKKIENLNFKNKLLFFCFEFQRKRKFCEIQNNYLNFNYFNRKMMIPVQNNKLNLI